MVTNLEWSHFEAMWKQTTAYTQNPARWRKMVFSEIPVLYPFSGSPQCYFGGAGRHQSHWLNDCTDRGVRTSPRPQPRNQRKCPRVKRGPQTWLAAREDRTPQVEYSGCCRCFWVGGRVLCLGDSFIIWVSEEMTVAAVILTSACNSGRPVIEAIYNCEYCLPVVFWVKYLRKKCGKFGLKSVLKILSNWHVSFNCKLFSEWRGLGKAKVIHWFIF